MKITYTQKKIKGKTSSFFYEGQVAFIEDRGFCYSLEACGDIRLHNEKKNQEIWNSNAGTEYILNDKQLNRAEKDGWYWDNNNWFEVIFWNLKEKQADSVLGDVAYDYDEGIALLKGYVKERIAEQK